MRKITLTNDFRRNRTSFENAKAAFIKFCKLKNLTERTIEFYEEDLMYLQNYVNAKYLDEITQETLDDFILEELDKGRRTTTLNTRLRGLRVFFKFCAEREYMEELSIKLLKDDAELKEPYTDAELRKLLVRPKSNRWNEYRSWAMIYYLVATGNRARTIVNIKISDRAVYSSNDFFSRLIFVKIIKLLLVPAHFKNIRIGCRNNKLFDSHFSILWLFRNYGRNKFLKLLCITLWVAVKVRLDVVYQYIPT